MGNGSVSRECTIAARDKLIAETGLNKIKMILGWIIDFRCLRGVSLPKNKYVALTEHGKDLTIGMSSAAKELKQQLAVWAPYPSLVVQGIHRESYSSWQRIARKSRSTRPVSAI
jgi:hypothetical protein